MSRSLLAMSVVFFLATVASADVGPRPGRPPVRQLKLIPVVNSVKFSSNFPDFAFYGLMNGPNRISLVKMTPDVKKPHQLILPDGVQATIYAVPKDQVKNYPTTKDFVQAVSGLELPNGIYMSDLIVKQSEALPNDNRTGIKRVITIAGDAKKGITFTASDDASQEPEPEPTADVRSTPRLMLVGGASALAILFSGLWFFRRK